MSVPLRVKQRDEVGRKICDRTFAPVAPNSDELVVLRNVVQAVMPAGVGSRRDVALRVDHEHGFRSNKRADCGDADYVIGEIRLAYLDRDRRVAGVQVALDTRLELREREIEVDTTTIGLGGAAPYTGS